MLIDESLSKDLSYPFSNDASVDQLRTALQKKLVKNLTTLIKKVKSFLRLDSETVLHTVQKLDDSQRFSPLLYFYYFLLLDALVASNKDQMARYYDLLASMSLDELYHPILTINDQSHNAIINYYVGLPHANKEVLENLNQDEFGFAKSNLAAAMEIIQKSNQDYFHEIDALVSMVHVGKGSIAWENAVNMKYFGWVYLPYKKLPTSENPVLYYFDKLVHATSHLYLDLITTFDPIVDNVHELYDFPLYNTQCSMKDIFYSYFIFYRLVKSYQFCSNFFVTPMGNPQKFFEEKPQQPLDELPMIYETRLPIYRYCLKETREVVNRYGVLTRTGKKLLENMCL